MNPRRSLLALMVSAASILSGCGGGGDDAPSGGAGAGGGCITLADGKCVTETFHDPALLQPDAEGVYHLELRPVEFTFDGKRHCGRGYNGQYPAPTIDTKARKGDEQRKVRVNLKNTFTKSDLRTTGEEACTCTDKATNASCAPHSGHTSSDTCVCKTAEGKSCHLFDFNVTNLHAHGSHVRPDFASGAGCVEKDGYRCRSCSSDGTAAEDCFFADDVISRVLPGQGVQHRWDIDEDGTHHAGLDWYHPHIHGSTAIQVAGGATGAWIIRGALDEIPGVKNAKERVLLLTTPSVGFAPLADGVPCDEDHLTVNDFAVLGDTAEKQTNLVNGLRRPRIVMPPGQIERWRILHGAYLDEVFLVLARGKDSDCSALDLTKEPVRLTQIGRDGVPLAKPASGEGWPYAPTSIFMSPGYRVEAMLDGSGFADGDNLCLVAARFLQEDTTGTTKDVVGLTKAPTPEEVLKAASNGDVIAVINVAKNAGAPTETKMPDLSVVAAESLPMKLQGGTLDVEATCKAKQAEKDLAKIDQLSALWMIFANTDAPDGCACSDHNVNCKNFEHTDRDKYPFDRVLKKGAVDHWRVVSGFDGHPFHIHINPYVVCPLPPEGSSDPNAKGRIFEPPFAHYRDTYLVNLDRTLDALTEYKAFTGNYVYHCHKLTHEDHGMMELLRVCDPATEACDELCSGGPCAWRSCASGDDACKRALAATECLFDPTKCPEAGVRCKHCNDGPGCPAGAHCRSEADYDEVLRCAPGCGSPDECPVTDTCAAGQCVPAPCAPPCLPGSSCVHGACQ